MKSDDTFIVVDSYGDIGASAGGPDGLFHCDTRFLSRLELTINQLQPLLLGSNVRDDNTLLTVDLTNPDMFADGRLVLHKDTLHIVRTIFLWRGAAYQRLADEYDLSHDDIAERVGKDRSTITNAISGRSTLCRGSLPASRCPRARRGASRVPARARSTAAFQRPCWCRSVLCTR